MSIMSQEAKKQAGCVLHWTGAVASANSPKQITSYGDVKQLLPFPGAGIGMFDGNGDYLAIPDSDDWNILNSNFTIECCVYFTSVSSLQAIVTQIYDGTVYWNVYWDNTTNKINLKGVSESSTVLNFTCPLTPTINTWYTIAVERSGSSCLIFINGIQQTVTVVTNWPAEYPNVNAELRIARGGSTYLTGYMSELRISNVARYTTNFTPPKRQLESDSNTKLLLHFNRNDTTFVDSSPSAHSITAYGNAKQLCSPCGSGVAYFDGNGDYIQTPSNISDFTFSTNNFTIEGWIYPTAVSGYDIIEIYNTFDGVKAFSIHINSSGYLVGMSYNSSGTTIGHVTGSTNIVNQWSHFAYVRNGNIFTLYLNGVSIGTADSTVALQTGGSTSPVRIGAERAVSAWYYYTGYVSDIRIINGVAKYTSNFTPSTQPLRPDPNTKLLLHMDGVGNAFYDSSDPPGDNGFPILPDGVTVTPSGTFAVEKMKDGRNIWKFDGSTNYITISDHASWSMFLNDFTIAGWVKLDSIAANKVIIGQYVDANNQWYLQWTTGNIIQLYGITSSTARFDFSCPLAAVANTWYHIVVQRSGSSCIMYINGVAQTVTQTTAFSATATDIAAVLSIGKINTGYQTGNIKDLQIFTKALTMDQISALYQETFIY